MSSSALLIVGMGLLVGAIVLVAMTMTPWRPERPSVSRAVVTIEQQYAREAPGDEKAEPLQLPHWFESLAVIALARRNRHRHAAQAGRGRESTGLDDRPDARREGARPHHRRPGWRPVRTTQSRGADHRWRVWRRVRLLSAGPAPVQLRPETAGQDPPRAARRPGHPRDRHRQAALHMVGDQVGQSEPAAVVVVSDGRQNRNGGDLPEAARRLADRRSASSRSLSAPARSHRTPPLKMSMRPTGSSKATRSSSPPCCGSMGFTRKTPAASTARSASRSPSSFAASGVGGDVASDELIDSQTIDVKIPAEGERNQAHPVVNFAEKKDRLPDPGLYDYRVEIKPVEDETSRENNSQTVARRGEGPQADGADDRGPAAVGIPLRCQLPRRATNG